MQNNSGGMSIMMVLLMAVAIAALSRCNSELGDLSGIGNIATGSPWPTRTSTATETPTPTPESIAEINAQPFWRCATPTPVPTTCPDNADGTPVCNTPEPTATPYVLLSDFPPGGHVQIGPIGREDIGVWAWLQNPQVFETDTIPEEWEWDEAWIATWDVYIENASTGIKFDFFPSIFSWISEVQLEDGTTITHWPESNDEGWRVDLSAANELANRVDPNVTYSWPWVGYPNWDFFLLYSQSELEARGCGLEFYYLDFGICDPIARYWTWWYLEDEEFLEDNSASQLDTGDLGKARMAAYIPGPIITKMAYSFSLAIKLFETEFAESPRNDAIWRTTPNADDILCPGEVTPGPDGFDAIPRMGLDVDGVELARWPVNSGTITRGFGCVSEVTGIRGSGCPSDAPWFHNGIDIAVTAGSPYIDSLGVSSEVEYAGEDADSKDCSEMSGSNDPHTGLGIYIEQYAVMGQYEVKVIGGHLSSVSVQTSQALPTPGEIIGLTGSTGCSTGDHLHFTVLVDGEYVDPLDVLPDTGP